MKLINKNRRQVAKPGGFITLILIAVVITTGFAIKEKTEDLWKQLGIQEQNATINIHRSFFTGLFQYYGARNIKNIESSAKLSVAQDLLDYTKQYINNGFKAAYEKDRLAVKPREPGLKTVRTKEQIQKEEVNNLEESIRNMEGQMKTATEDLKKIYQTVLVQNKQLLEDYKKPGNELFELMAMGEKNQREQQVAGYQEDLKKWKETYPEDYRLLVKERLIKMLELTNNVDFGAELKEVYNRKKFVKPEYERKSREWKMAFRAGKEVTNLTRLFAEQWLRELK